MENMCRIEKRGKIVWGCLFCLSWQIMLRVEYRCNPRMWLRGKTCGLEAFPKMVATMTSGAFGGTTLVSKCVSAEIRVTE